jgi:hypothetical protein
LRPCLLAVLRRRHARTHSVTHGACIIIRVVQEPGTDSWRAAAKL